MDFLTDFLVALEFLLAWLILGLIAALIWVRGFRK